MQEHGLRRDHEEEGQADLLQDDLPPGDPRQVQAFAEAAEGLLTLGRLRPVAKRGRCRSVP
jgi:hypothetical protein